MRSCKYRDRVRSRHRRSNPPASTNFAPPWVMAKPPSADSAPPAVLASTPRPGNCNSSAPSPPTIGIAVASPWNIEAIRSRTCVTKTCSASPSRWPTSRGSAVCGGRKACTKVCRACYSSQDWLVRTFSPANLIHIVPADTNLEAKRTLLQSHLCPLGRLLVAYSGGVDSAYLAWAAHQALGSNMLAIIADSPSLARTQLADAVAFASEQSIPLEVVATSELDRPEYARNDSQRCFFCKDELFTLMEELRQARGFDAIAYGVNLDDQGDFRPGQRAAANHRVVRPLFEVGLSKDEIRALAREAGLRVWDKPASACLSSRIEYGRPVTREALATVERGEDALRALGFRQLRVRHHGEIVRIEIAGEELPRALDPAMAAKFASIFKALGFKFVTLDVEGFRSGSMNTLLPAEELLRRTG